MNTLSAGNVSRNRSPLLCRGLAPRCVAVVLTLCISGCMSGPNYHTPSVQVPESFKEGTDWQRAHANPQGSLSSVWWREYHDDRLTQLVEQSLEVNQSIVAAEAAYQLSLAIVQVNTASLFPMVMANASGSRTGTGANAASAAGNATVGSTVAGVRNTVSVSAAASWEIDLWGAIRREIESAKESAQATDAQLAGERLSIAASVATNYFRLRQADIDIQSLKQQQDIDARILVMMRGAFVQGEASNDQVLAAQDTLEVVVADLQATETAREQDEHALAVLTGVPPAGFTLPPDPSYAFVLPDVPLALPSQLLERRYDVVSAERTAASANARIGVAEAAFFPTLTLSAQGGFQHNTFAHLFSLPSRVWTLGPDLAATIFDGGARTAAVREARAIYDEDAATYRNTVLTAFESVEDSLSSVNHLREQTQAFANIFQRNQQLFASETAQLMAGAASQQQLLTQQLTLIQAEQNLKDTQALLTQGSVTLIRNLGGGWQWGDDPGGSLSSTSSGKDVSFSSKSNLQEAPTPAPD
ncbi:efflux transporter outer membrane subunit [Paraburkholderia sp. BL9I2N2]|uniref:efflux transporter outer membrane subunit n=1 Tax=Paraburkholderia sp. BL9I2N2 TaxID=1938809 RepID=UPI001048C485|nr:efflux transporter outer membrane subunit [Paraburkholderia sp. BL9I2N2]TCK84342.1 NodT family efflux transporter outer membrane factor (OMF) lipoprotein [Paraburkholderia sp. BL9I2N2]